MDVIKLQAQCETKVFFKPNAKFFLKPKLKIFLKPLSQPLTQPPQNKGELLITEPANASQVAELLAQPTSRIIADVMQLGVFATPSQSLSFEVISKIALKYGFTVRRKS